MDEIFNFEIAWSFSDILGLGFQVYDLELGLRLILGLGFLFFF